MPRMTVRKVGKAFRTHDLPSPASRSGRDVRQAAQKRQAGEQVLSLNMKTQAVSPQESLMAVSVKLAYALSYDDA